MDIAHVNLELLIRKGTAGEVAESLRQWQGAMPEHLVRELGRFFDPSRKRREGRPRKRQKSSPGTDRLVLQLYFALVGDMRSKSEVFEQLGFSWYTDQKTGLPRSTEFERIRARFNAAQRADAIELFRFCESRTTATRQEIIDYVRGVICQDMPENYFAQYILPSL